MDIRSNKLVLLSVVGLLSLTSANAQLVNHYNLNTDGTDSVSGANGTLVNTGGTASFASGMLTTTGANSTDYLALPTNLDPGITGDFSIEEYVSTTHAGTTYNPTFSFGLGSTQSSCPFV